ncbi:MAG TPA: class I SAM-dependent methyltransferase [Fibrobacteria bacterium]|nr:class I SAM-dependent methyltransferase [Fibrobacteria bacterium]
METLAACPLCGSPELRGDGEKRDYVSGKSFRVQTCLACGLGFVNPRPDPEEIKAYYPSYYSWREDGSAGLANRLEKFYRYQSLRYETARLRAFTRLASGETLDVGCGSGDRLAVLEEAGFTPHGVEMGGAVEAALASGRWGITKGTVFSADFPPGKFSAVTFYNVIEHIHAPGEALRRARRWLKTDGALVVQLPNRLCWQARLFGLRWAAVDIPRDLFYFDARTLRSAIEEAGFEVTHIDHASHILHPPTWVLSLFPGLDPRLVWAENKLLKNLLKRAAWAAATAILGPLAKLEGLLGRGALITAYARPRPGA